MLTLSTPNPMSGSTGIRSLYRPYHSLRLFCDKNSSSTRTRIAKGTYTLHSIYFQKYPLQKIMKGVMSLHELSQAFLSISSQEFLQRSREREP